MLDLPQTRPLALRHSILRSVREIPRDDWVRLWGDQPEGYDYFCTLEHSALGQFKFYYICVYTADRLDLIAPVFSADFDLGIGTEGLAAKSVRWARSVCPRFLIERTLFCGSPFGEQGGLGLTNDSAQHLALLAELEKAMAQLSGQERLRFILFKDFPTATLGALDALRANGYFKGESFPNIVVRLPYATMTEYLDSLSYACRKDLRRKVRKTLSAGKMEVRVVKNVAPIIEEIYALYLQTYEAGTVRFEKLTKEYFLAVGQEMPEKTIYFLYYAGGKLAGFNLCFCHEDQLIDKFIGFDYAISRELNLYFYSWYYNVDWCIQHRIRLYQVGQTDYEAKIRLGGEKVPLSFYAKHNHALINAVLRAVARLLVPRG